MTPKTSTETPAVETESAPAAPTSAEPSTPTAGEETPDSGRTRSRGNAEAARYRTQLREAEAELEQLRAEKEAREAAAREEAEATARAARVTEVAEEYRVPEEVRYLLPEGGDEEALLKAARDLSHLADPIAEKTWTSGDLDAIDEALRKERPIIPAPVPSSGLGGYSNRSGTASWGEAISTRHGR